MPCWTVRTMSVEFKPKNYDILQKAAAAMGLTVTVNGQVATVVTPEGTLTITNGQASGPKVAVEKHVNNLRVNYSREIVKAASYKMGWNVRFASQNKMVVSKK